MSEVETMDNEDQECGLVVVHTKEYGDFQFPDAHAKYECGEHGHGTLEVCSCGLTAVFNWCEVLFVSIDTTEEEKAENESESQEGPLD